MNIVWRDNNFASCFNLLENNEGYASGLVCVARLYSVLKRYDQPDCFQWNLEIIGLDFKTSFTTLNDYPAVVENRMKMIIVEQYQKWNKLMNDFGLMDYK